MWWQTDEYSSDAIIPVEFETYCGPHGVPTVRVFPGGSTDTGWGMKDTPRGNFIQNYETGKFDPQIALIGALSGRWDFAFVMRGLNLVCIDIDGKNGGFASAGKLGLLPETLAETSRSGDGFHLFYETTNYDGWDDKEGFGLYRDRIGLYEGIDIRAVGCVYHYPTQRWNGKKIAKLPHFLHEKWTEQDLSTIKEAEMKRLLIDADPDELFLVRSNLERDLAAPIPAGRRNNTLFAIGTKMMLLDVDEWQRKVAERALAVGLDGRETDKLVSNIARYGAPDKP